MTDLSPAAQHPITPPPELVEKWVAEIWHEGTPVQVSASDIHVATQAARWATVKAFHLIGNKLPTGTIPAPSPIVKSVGLAECWG